MTTTPRIVASGPGWQATDVVCTAGPHSRPYEEQHEGFCVAAVTDGTFQYRSTCGTATMVAGALLLGNHHHCFECGHEHSTGDRCLSFRYAPDFMESMVAGVPGARRLGFSASRLPPLPTLVPLLAMGEAARDDGDRELLEELAVRLAGAATAALGESVPSTRSPSPADERRVAQAVRRIQAESAESASLAQMASEAAMSPYHFLRTFRQVAGMTPYQFLLFTRLRRAAVRLRRTADAISTIAVDAGFNDLSTFNRRFRQVMGISPGLYRNHGNR